MVSSTEGVWILIQVAQYVDSHKDNYFLLGLDITPHKRTYAGLPTMQFFRHFFFLCFNT